MISSLFVIAVIKAVFLVPWKWIEDFIWSKFVLKLSDVSYVSSVRQRSSLKAEILQGDNYQSLWNIPGYVSANNKIFSWLQNKLFDWHNGIRLIIDIALANCWKIFYSYEEQIPYIFESQFYQSIFPKIGFQGKWKDALL